MIHISPSILAADFTRLGEEIRAAEAGGGSIIHVDVMDGRFVPNITMGPLVVAAARRSTALPLDVHLMIVEPERHLAAFAEAGASRIFVHWEVCPNLHRTLQQIRELGCGVGVAINPHTPASSLSEVRHLLDAVLVMTVNPGFGGQAFLPETLPKIRELRALAGNQPLDIGVDGGIDVTTAPQVVQAGANVLVAGTAIFGHAAGEAAAIAHLRQALSQNE